MKRGVILGALIGASVWLFIHAVTPWWTKEIARIETNRALTCREGFVKIERRLLRPVCVPGYEP